MLKSVLEVDSVSGPQSVMAVKAKLLSNRTSLQKMRGWTRCYKRPNIGLRSYSLLVQDMVSCLGNWSVPMLYSDGERYRSRGVLT